MARSSRPRHPSAEGLRRRGPALPARHRASSRHSARRAASIFRRRRRASSAETASSMTPSRSCYDEDPRVLTITGPGGTGKTRFAIELARLLSEEAEGGTVFVPLAPLRDADLIVPAVAQVLGAPEPSRPRSRPRSGSPHPRRPRQRRAPPARRRPPRRRPRRRRADAAPLRHQPRGAAHPGRARVRPPAARGG